MPFNAVRCARSRVNQNRNPRVGQIAGMLTTSIFVMAIHRRLHRINLHAELQREGLIGQQRSSRGGRRLCAQRAREASGIGPNQSNGPRHNRRATAKLNRGIWRHQISQIDIGRIRACRIKPNDKIRNTFARHRIGLPIPNRSRLLAVCPSSCRRMSTADSKSPSSNSMPR